MQEKGCGGGRGTGNQFGVEGVNLEWPCTGVQEDSFNFISEHYFQLLLLQAD